LNCWLRTFVEHSRVEVCCYSILIVVVFFENTELDELIQNEPKDSEGIYTQVIAEQIALEKQLIVKELKKNGIFAILTPPADLNVNTINKYLELKARGMV